MKPIPLLLAALALLFSISVESIAQNVTAFYETIVSSPPSDTILDQHIDSLWEATLTMDGDTSPHALLQRSTYADELHNTFTKKPNSTSNQKAALYAHFIWLRNQYYQEIITKYQNHNYPTDLWIAGYPIYRRSFFKHHGNGARTKWKDQLLVFKKSSADSILHVFIDQEINPEIGENAPSIIHGDIYGNPFNLDSLKGSVVLLDFWATWCGPCRSETPYLRRWHRDYSYQHFKIVSISRDKNVETLLDYVDDANMPWTHIHDGFQKLFGVAGAYGVKALPQYYLIGRDGTIKWESGTKRDFLEITQMIEHELATY